MEEEARHTHIHPSGRSKLRTGIGRSPRGVGRSLEEVGLELSPKGVLGCEERRGKRAD